MTPKEIRLFRKGWNKTSKGNFLFDATSALAVMADYKRAGIDIMIDLEHNSLEKESAAYNPDAQAWCKLTLRNGELWATQVEWTPEGEERLTNKKQRYVSPTFEYDPETHRILSIYNIAICAIPATYDAPALVAASKRAGKKNYATLAIEVDDMDEALKKIAVALGLADDATLEDVLAAVKVLQEDEGDGGEGDEETTSDDDSKDKDDDKDTETTSDDEMLSGLPPKAQARVMAIAASNETLRKRLERLEKNSARSEIETLMKDNADKIPLRFESWARKQTPENLREFLKHSDSLPDKKKTLSREPQREEDTGGVVVSLTDADRAVIARSGSTPEKFLETKKKIVERDRRLKGA